MSVGQFTSSSVSPSSYSSAARFTGGGSVTDFQPPYFPPPFPQQQLEFHNAATGDAYSHLNTFQTHQPWSHAVATGPRRDAQEAALHSFQTANGQLHSFQQAYDARRGEYPQIRRPDILVHTGVHSGIPSDQDLMQLSSQTAMLQQVMEVDGQVSLSSVNKWFKIPWRSVCILNFWKIK